MNFFGNQPRDPARIPHVLAKIQELWEKVPDLRLGQFLGNTCKSETQLYYLEDDDLLEKLESMYKEADKSP
jgi:uncharacterized protein YihD (DUF1040 family)